MADEFAPPPALEPAPAAAARRADFREPPLVGRRHAVPRWAWVAIASGVAAIGAGLAAAVIVDARAAALEPAALGTTGRLHSAQVVAGMCLLAIEPADGPAGTATVVACDQPHSAEALASYPFASDEWPGPAEIRRTVLDFCSTQLGPDGPLSRAATNRTWVAWTPSERTWAAGDRTGLCIVSSDQPWTGHAMDSLVGQPT